ncbi:Phytochrome-like protein cph2 [compost metagenome]
MVWLGLHLSTVLPSTGQVLLDCRHNPFLVLLACLVAWAGSFATLHIAERVSHVEHANAQRQWRLHGAFCLAGGIWAMHFISMLAFEPPLETRYDLSITGASLLVMLLAAILAMETLSQPALTPLRYLQASTCIGLGIVIMHYIGMAALQSNAVQYYDPELFALSVALAIFASLCALVLARHFRNGDGTFHQLLKYLASLVMAAGIVSVHFTAMAALSLVVPQDHAVELPVAANNSLQLSLTIACITLLIIASNIRAALADKKLQSKEHDLLHVNALLSQLDQARLSLQQVAHLDALTNLTNRRGFNEIFADKLGECSANQGMLAVMFLDIDHFKRINDSLGHDAGDELLQIIAGIIKSATRSHDDVVARLGGDEFCILFSMSNRDEARHMAQRIMHKMKEPIALVGRRMVMTTSIGISVFPDDGTTCDELLKNADLALYQSKGNGRNNLNFFSGDLKARATLELQLEEELRTTLVEDNGLELYYQPIFDLHTGQVTKLEALIRWQHPQHGLLGPERFIGIAETNGLIAELDRWVLRQACQDLNRLSQSGYEQLKITVNCSALNLCREELAGEIDDALRTAKVAPCRLELEITEHDLMDNIISTAALFKKIRALGVSLSIDDFGTGYSSLAYLKRLSFDTLKIDCSFIQDIPTSRQDMEIVQAIIVMAHTLRLKVITEGVETIEQFGFLEEHGCDFAQGYLLSRPVPLRDLKPTLERINLRHSASSIEFTRFCSDSDTDGSTLRDLLPDSPAPHASASIARPGR